MAIIVRLLGVYVNAIDDIFYLFFQKPPPFWRQLTEGVRFDVFYHHLQVRLALVKRSFLVSEGLTGGE